MAHPSASSGKGEMAQWRNGEMAQRHNGATAQRQNVTKLFRENNQHVDVLFNKYVPLNLECIIQ
jgi:hypothetical protein